MAFGIVLPQQMFFHTFFVTYKAKRILNRHISCFCSDPIDDKCIKKAHKVSHFFKVYHFSINQHFPVVNAQVRRAIIIEYTFINT